MNDTTLEYAPELPSRRIPHQPDGTFDNSDHDNQLAELMSMSMSIVKYLTWLK